MTARELREILFKIEEQDSEIVEFKFSEVAPQLIITIELEKGVSQYTFNI